MDELESLSHTKWDCKYHVVFIPKCRRKTLYLELRRHLGEVFRRLAGQKEARIEEGHLMPDHLHMMISIPPKYAVSQSDRIHQREERNPPGPCLRRTNAQLRRAAFLGKGILRLDRRSRRSGDQGVHPQAGGRGYWARLTEYVALRPPSGGQQNRGRVSVPTAALSGPIPKALGFAGILTCPFGSDIRNGACCKMIRMSEPGH